MNEEYENDSVVYTLRQEGKTFEEIGEVVGLSRQRCHIIYGRARKRFGQPLVVTLEGGKWRDANDIINEKREKEIAKVAVRVKDFRRRFHPNEGL